MLTVRHGDIEYRFSGITRLFMACDVSEDRGGSMKPFEEHAEVVYDHRQCKFTKSRQYDAAVLNARLTLMRLGASHMPSEGELQLLESFV